MNLRRANRSQARAHFGVDQHAIEHDRLISHILAALAADPGLTPIAFFGGSSLHRTYVGDERLSEDIDLHVRVRADWVRLFETHTIERLQRQWPDATWELIPSPYDHVTQGFVRVGDLTVTIQAIEPPTEYPKQPTQVRLRYNDAPAEYVEIPAPTVASFGALKAVAWADRAAPRDLFDLACLAELGALDSDAAQICTQLRGSRPQPAEYERLPQRTAAQWGVDLQNARFVPDAEECLRVAREAWAESLGWDNGPA